MRSKLAALALSLFLATSASASASTHPRLGRQTAWLNAVSLADRIDNELYRGSYLTDEISNVDDPDQSYEVDAEVTRARRESPYRCRLRVYFYDGPSSQSRFIGLAKVIIRVDRRGLIRGDYGWLKFPRRPPG